MRKRSGLVLANIALAAALALIAWGVGVRAFRLAADAHAEGTPLTHRDIHGDWDPDKGRLNATASTVYWLFGVSGLSGLFAVAAVANAIHLARRKD